MNRVLGGTGIEALSSEDMHTFKIFNRTLLCVAFWWLPVINANGLVHHKINW
jgi:hypothetical protein